MIYWQLILVYLKIGMFGFGGGYAMLSLIQYEVVDHHHWLTLQQFTDVVAISQMTPGPIGINSATYVGYAVTQSVGSCRDHHCSMSSSFILVLLISYFFVKCKGQQIHQGGNVGTAAHVRIIDSCCCPIADEQGKFRIDYKSILIFAAAFGVTWKWNLHPILLIILAGVAGFLLY